MFNHLFFLTANIELFDLIVILREISLQSMFNYLFPPVVNYLSNFQWELSDRIFDENIMESLKNLLSIVLDCKTGKGGKCKKKRHHRRKNEPPKVQVTESASSSRLELVSPIYIVLFKNIDLCFNVT